jgi:hypothetical protein
MEEKESNVKIEIGTNKKLTKISRLRRDSGDAVWRKKDITAELIAKEYKRNFK